MSPEQLTSTPTKQDILSEKIQKLAMKTHEEVQQREDIRRDLAEGMKFVPPDLGVEEQVFYSQESEQNSARTRIWKMVEGGNYCCQRPYGSWCDHFSGKCKQVKETFGHSGFGRTSRVV